MALRVALAAGHGTNRQHGLKLALFEVRDQGNCDERVGPIKCGPMRKRRRAP